MSKDIEMQPESLKRPIFVKANLGFQLDGVRAQYEGRMISLFGVTSLPWDKFKPEAHFGKEVSVTVQVTGKVPLMLTVPALVIREHSGDQHLMGLRFKLPANARKELSAVIEKQGFVPPDHTRKFPRIPFDDTIKTFPVNILVGRSQKERFVFSVENVSIGGILLVSENLNTDVIKPGEVLQLFIEPRGTFDNSIALKGQVCWTLDEINPDTTNVLRHVGVQFTQLDADNRGAFMELMKSILNALKKAAAGAP